MKIIQCVFNANMTKLARIPIYIVIHYTASTKSAKGKALEIAKMFSNPNYGASADFIVDDNDIVQYNADPINYYCWAVGGGKYNDMSTSLGGRLHGIATNKNCVSIEICSSKRNSKSINATDTDWYFTEDAILNAIELTKYLMDLYNIPIKNVIMHHEVTGKICPSPFCVNEQALEKWYKFKSALEGKYKNKKYSFISPSIIRTSPTLSINNKVKYDDLSKAMKKQCSKGVDGVAIANGKITIVETFKDNNIYWGKTKSGHYVVLEYNGKVRVK